jgi:hypothetical protein
MDEGIFTNPRTSEARNVLTDGKICICYRVIQIFAQSQKKLISLIIIIIIIIIIYLTENGMSPGGSGYNACT